MGRCSNGLQLVSCFNECLNTRSWFPAQGLGLVVQTNFATNPATCGFAPPKRVQMVDSTDWVDKIRANFAVKHESDPPKCFTQHFGLRRPWSASFNQIRTVRPALGHSTQCFSFTLMPTLNAGSRIARPEWTGNKR